MNVLKPHLRVAVKTLLDRGATQREIERMTGEDRKTIRRYQRQANSPGVATGSEVERAQILWPPAPVTAAGASASGALGASACEPHREWIEAQVGLGRNAVSIYQDLVEAHGFTRTTR